VLGLSVRSNISAVLLLYPIHEATRHLGVGLSGCFSNGLVLVLRPRDIREGRFG